MGNFLARSAAVGLVAGGFAFTGDLGWLADRGRRLLQARDVPMATAPGSSLPASPGMPAVAGPVAFPPACGPTTASPATPAAPMTTAPPVGPNGTAPAAVAGPPAGGPERLALRPLRPGSRVVVWIAPAGGGGPLLRLVVDLVDPANGAAIVSERIGSAPAAPARRVTLRTDSDDGVIVRGGSIHLAGTGIAGADDGGWLGPIAAIETGD